jgi:hypothetical protein
VGTKLLYAASLQVDGGVLSPNFTCKPLGPAGFGYTAGFNGLNELERTTLEGARYGGGPGDSFLNFTHIDFAGYRCGCADANFDTSIISFVVTLESNSSRFSMKQPEYAMDVESWADPFAWPYCETLREPIVKRNDTTYVAPNMT